ncbi:MAG: hypothetical protein AAGI38_03365 [Bacteroidota bacterium]
MKTEEVVEEMEEEIFIFEPPEPVLPVPPNELGLVASNLRKPFPKKDHIRIAKGMGIAIEDIYYYQDRSQIKLIHVKTDQVEEEAKLREITESLNTIFWDFAGMDFNVIFSANSQRYALSSSGEDFGKIHTTIYGYAELMDDLSRKLTEWKIKDDYPFKDKEVLGIFIQPIYLSNVQKSNFRITSFYFFVKETNEKVTLYTANQGRIYTQSPSYLRLDKKEIMYNEVFGSTQKADKYGDLLCHENKNPFQERYIEFLLRVE